MAVKKIYVDHDYSNQAIISLGRINFNTTSGDLSSPVNGDVWYNSTTSKFRKKEGGVVSDLGGSSNSPEILSRRYLAGPLILGSVVGTTTENILETITISAGKYVGGAGALLQLKASISANSTLSKRVLIRVSNSVTPTIANGTLIADSGVLNLLQIFINKEFNISATGINWANFNGGSVNVGNLVDMNGTNYKTGVTLDFTQPISFLITTVVGASNVGFGVNINSHSLTSY